jgi:hypothetical protein
MSAKIEDGLVIPYLTLRRPIGFLGVLWPFGLAFRGMLLFQTTLQDTISAYYYKPMFGIFVVWAVGFFLFTIHRLCGWIRIAAISLTVGKGSSCLRPDLAAARNPKAQARAASV